MYAFQFYNYSYLNLSSVSEAQAPKMARVLNFSHNMIEKIAKRDFEGFDALEVLDLAYNQIKDIEPGVFENLLSLVSVNFSFNDKKLDVSGLASGLKLLPTIEASGGLQLYKYFETSSETALESSVSAKELRLSEGPADRLSVNPRFRRSKRDPRRAEKNVTVSPTAGLRPNFCGTPINGILDLSKSKLSEEELMEKLDADLCQAQLDSILELNISRSNLEMDLLSLFILFLPMKNVRSIDASYNKITINNIDVEAICHFPFHNLFFLNISNNPMNNLDTVCLPSTIKINGRENLRCSFPPDRRGSLVESSNLTLLRCSLGIQMAITACVAILIVLLLTGLCWHFDGVWYLRMGWYWCMAKRKQYEKRPENKPYDAFISYSEHDANWTKENLLEKLETKGFKICYHERDFKPGHPVLGNIFYCIENSHKVLFVLSPSFVNSCWCQYELYFAEHRVLNENQDSLIMIVLEDLPFNSVPQKFSKLRKLLKRKTYLKWSPEQHKQKVFWHQLTAVLKTTNEPFVLRAENGSTEDMYEME
ncbi:toll-like receptor 2 [Apteryx rowi]|uniref:toll-like receptor 2 n=1 Tax=Apteryx rowi TaxID=308060 RepID=UPI000E1D7759|nr:toll-like receptor 2 [Apteryx rowi]